VINALKGKTSSAFNLSELNSPPLAVKFVKLFLKTDTPLLAAGSFVNV
jgi:hypothetical protein